MKVAFFIFHALDFNTACYELSYDSTMNYPTIDLLDNLFPKQFELTKAP